MKEPKTILIADDEQVFLRVCAEYLEDGGHNVLPAESGAKALEICRSHAGRIDCVMLDLTMPDSDTGAVIREIRRLRPETKMLIVSGYAKEDEPFVRIAAEKPDGFLRKPFDFKELTSKIKEVLGIS